MDLFLNNSKQINYIKDFAKELIDFLDNNLKNEETVYQVVDIVEDGAYLQNTKDNKIVKKSISKEILKKIGNDTVLRYKNGKYIIDEKLTQKFLDSLIDVKEYEDIKNQFIKESKISNINQNIKYKIDEKNDEYSILKYGNNQENKIKVPNALIPFWTSVGDNLYYKNGEFNKDFSLEKK